MANTDNLKPFRKGYDSRRGSKPRGSKHISTYIREILEDDNFIYSIDNGMKHQGAPIKAMITALAVKAAEGDIRAFDVLAKHGYSPRLQVELVDKQPLTLTASQAEQLLRLRASRPTIE